MKHLAVLALCLVSAFSARAETDRIITTTGQGAVEAVPDMARLSLGVTEQAEDAATALAATSATMSAILERLVALGLAERDVQTGSVSLQPLWLSSRGETPSEPEIIGYVARNSLDIRVRDLAMLGGLLDAVAENGANTFNGLSFALQDPEPVQSEARAAAVRDAMSRAGELAAAAGVVLGPVQSISEGSGARPRLEMAAARMSDSGGVPVAAGEVTVSAQVTMVFAISE